MSNPINRLALGLLFICSLPAIAQPANVNQATNEFQPLPRLQVTPDQDKNKVYMMGPNGRIVVTDNLQPSFVISNGKVIPYTNSVRSRPTLPPGTNLVSQPRSMLPEKAQAEFQAAIKTFIALKQKDPNRILRLEQLITEANEQPEVAKKLQEIQRLVHDYVGKKSPKDIEALEIMTKPKEIMEHNGLPGNLVY